MGRYYIDAKRTVESSIDLSIFRMNRWGLLKHGRSGTLTWTSRLTGNENTIRYAVEMGQRPDVRLFYTTTKPSGEKFDFDYRIELASSPCNYGGQRYWFICPLCLRRAGIVYLTGKHGRFICRECGDLTYDKRNEPHLARFGQLAYRLVAERQYEELYRSIKRWTWSGRPTRKAKKLYLLEKKMAQSPPLDINDLLTI